MKYLFLLIALSIASFNLNAQAPSAIPYQAVARNSSGNLIANQNISLRFSIREGSAMGTVIYRETQSALTNALGLFSVNIGQGAPVTGVFGNINWAGGSKFMQVELDASGGSSYTDMGTQQMLSVPYALYANSGGTPPTAGAGISVTGTTITNTSPDQPVTLTGTGATTVTGTYPNFTVNSTDANTTYTGGTGINITGTTITNTAPDQTVTLTGTGATTVTGTYPNFTVNSTDNNTTYTGGTGINVTGTTITNTAPDQTVTLTGSGATTVTGTYPNFTVNSTDANTTYTGGTGIDVTGTTITNTSPTQWVNNGSNISYSSGNVGIGASSPSSPLEIQASVQRLLKLRGTSSLGTWLTIDNGDYEWSLITTGTGNTEGTGNLLFRDLLGVRMIIKPFTGNVGIGTDNPAQKLEVNGTTKTSGFQMTNGATSGYLLQSDASGNATWVSPGSFSGTNYWTLSGNNLYNNNGTNIGIGTSSPGYRLSLKGTANETYSVWSEDGTQSANHFAWQIAPGDGTSTGRIGYFFGNFGNSSGFQISNSANGPLRFGAGVGSPEWMRITAGGQVGIGTTSPSEKLEVSGKTKTTNLQMTNGAASGYVLQSDASGNATWVSPGSLSGTNYWTLNGSSLYNNSGTNVGIGTTEPVNKLDVEGGLAVGSSYSGNSMAPSNGVIIEGNVGIGTTEPVNKLDVEGGLAVGESYSGTSSAPNNGAIIEGNVGIGTNAPVNKLDIQGGLAVGSAYSGNSTAPSNGVIIEGNVGIGTQSPTDKLDLEGNMRINENNIYFRSNTDINHGMGYFNDTAPNGTFAGLDLDGPAIWGYGGGALGTSANSAKTWALRWTVGGTVYMNGVVGIGTTAPTQAKLVVNGSQSNNIGGYGFLNDNGNAGTGSGTHNYSIYASDRISASEFNAFSDARVKNILGVSNSRADLQTLMGIQITNYKLKDYISKGNQEYKKVIAQQVEEVYPQAVTKIIDVVPDIYQLAEIRQGHISLANTLHPGDKVKLIFGERSEVTEVITADAQGFKVNLPDEGKVFVYGRQVDDFRTVDYEALSMLHISATQELVKMIQHLEVENQSMKSDISQIKATLQNLVEATTSSHR